MSCVPVRATHLVLSHALNRLHVCKYTEILPSKPSSTKPLLIQHVAVTLRMISLVVRNCFEDE
jgi:hypothetical protein